MKPVETCAECGAKKVEYRHSINAALVLGLYRLHEAGGEKNLAALSLTRNQWDNFQKLRYWGLVEKSRDGDGQRIGGSWKITDLGIQFLSGEAQITRSVWTYRGETQRSDGELISAGDFLPKEYKQREEYAHEAIRHEE